MNKIVPKDAVLIPKQAECVFKGQIFNVYQWPQKMFDGSSATFEMLKRPDTVIVLAVVNDKIMVIEDEQPHTGSRLGFPGGRVDESDDSTLAAAQREVREETGYEFKVWRLLEVIQNHKKLEWFIYYYLASDGQKVAEPKLDAGEKIAVKLVSFDELKQLVFDKAGYLGQAEEIFRNLNTLKDLISRPEFSGKTIEY